MLTTYVIVALVAYLLGSIPFGYILVKLFLKQDIRKTGSGNIGATNVARSGKKGLAVATLLLDAAKGATPVWMVGSLAYRYPAHFGAVGLREFGADIPDIHEVAVWAGLAALFAILGHCFPIWLRFRGGKGVATAIGAFAVLQPRAAGLAFLIFVVLFLLMRVVSVSSIVAAAAFPFIAARNRTWDTDAYAQLELLLIIFLSSLIVILKHHSNIRRLLDGTEPKFGSPKQALPADPIQAEKNA